MNKSEINRDKNGDWPEDFNHENGNYHNVCKYADKGCGRTFVGHKRRVQCKVCAVTQMVLFDSGN